MRFLNIDGSNEEDIPGELINTKLENLEKLKFDDETWQIDPTKFIIHRKFYVSKLIVYYFVLIFLIILKYVFER